jgi:hypothetical protein
VFTDAPPTPAANQIAFRVINAYANATNAPVNVYIRQRRVNATTIDSLPDTPTFGNLAFGAASAYAAFPTDTAALDSARIVVTLVGSKTPLALGGLAASEVKAPVGVAGTTSADPIAGARVSLSVLTAVILPASVGGSTAPQGGAFASPAAIYLVDKRPPKTAP